MGGETTVDAPAAAAAAESASPTSSASHSTCNNNDIKLSLHEQEHLDGCLHYLYILFWCIGLITKRRNEPAWFKYVTYFIFASIWVSFVVALTYALYKIAFHDGHSIGFVYIAILIWLTNVCTIYSILCYEMFWGENIFVELKELASDSSPVEQILRVSAISTGSGTSTAIERSNTAHELYAMCNTWIIVILLGAFYNMLSFHLVYPLEAMATDLLPTNHGEVGYALLPILIIFNVTTGVPTVVVRLSSYFLNKRITKLIEYLEKIQHENHDIVAVMCWYDGKFSSIAISIYIYIYSRQTSY
jgi:hypothetical protein